MFSFFTKKTKSFIALIAKNINKKFNDDIIDFIDIDGPITGKLYLDQPKEENIKFTIDKVELKEKVSENIYDKLPEKMFFV